MHARCLQIPPELKSSLRILYLAKHALSDGKPDSQDGTHATYHRELLDTLRGIGLSVAASNDLEILFERPDCDFLISMYNRAEFRSSEMFAPLLAERHGLPYLGGAPMVRGISDDKHFMKRLVRGLGIRTPDWALYPRGLVDVRPPGFDWSSLIVKPNASSASWGIEVTDSWVAALDHVRLLHAQGHDVIIEAYIAGHDLAAPVVGSITPWYLPVIQYGGDKGPIRTYEQKRDLVPSSTTHTFVTDPVLNANVRSACEAIVEDVWPFDHGRLEFRVDAKGSVYFIEMNLNCNLWSRKTIASVARQVGVGHDELVETIVCHSLNRQGLLPARAELAA